MKKVILIVLGLILVGAGLVSCGGTSTPTATQTT
jgi:hypothetical protein